jgi:hypothetical protein
MGRSGRQERKARYKGNRSGSSATHSQDYLLLVSRLYRSSEIEAAKTPGENWSYYVFAGMPMLLAALQALVVEYEYLIFSPKRREPPDVNGQEFINDYRISGELLDDLKDLIELRNEIIHPAHAVCGAADNWPSYLSSVKQRGILNSTGDPSADYSMLGQMASHRLFHWAVGVTRRLYGHVIESDPARAVSVRPFLKSFDPPWFEPTT